MEKQIITDFNKALDDIYKSLEMSFQNMSKPGLDASAFKYIYVNYYNQSMPLVELASIKHTKKQIVITPFDKESVSAIATVITKKYSDLIININNNAILINLPVLSEERRVKCTKELKDNCEKYKIQARNLRRSFNQDIKNNKEISENIEKMLHEQIQEKIDEFNKRADEFFANKKQIFLSL